MHYTYNRIPPTRKRVIRIIIITHNLTRVNDIRIGDKLYEMVGNPV
jgi:hypothetical protein